jgi:hypothetical protein
VLDLSAAYRLLRLANSTHVEAVRLDWEAAFKALRAAKETLPESKEPTSQEKTLADLLVKVQKRKEAL